MLSTDLAPLRPPIHIARQWLALLAAASLAWAGAAWWLQAERSALQRHESEKLQVLVQTLDGIVSQQMLAIKAALDTVAVQRRGWRTERLPQDSAALLQTLAQAMPGVRVLMLVDAQGRVRASSVPQLLGLDVRSRDYFSVPQQRPDPGLLYVSPPFRSVMGVHTLTLARALFDAQGRFEGVVTASLDPDYFRLVLETAQPSPDTWSALAHTGGLLFSMTPPDERWIGRNLLAMPDSILARHLASGQSASLHRMRAQISQDERLAAARHVSPAGLRTDAGLLVAVGRALQGIEAPWRRQLHAVLLIGGLLSLGMAAALLLWQRRQRLIFATAQQAAFKLQEQAQHTQAILDHMVDAVITIDSAGQIASFNPAAERIFGYPAAEAIGRNISLLMPEPDSGRHADYLSRYLAGGPARVIGQGRDVDGRRKSGEVFPMSLAVSRIERRGQTLFIGLARDISDRKRAEAAIERLAFYDPLTTLPNRRLLLDRLAQSLAASQRSGRHGAVLFIDIDNFKSLNDTLGHGMGDRLLKSMAQRLQAALRAQDSVARWGGDEFVVLLQDLGADAGVAALHAEAAAEKLLRVLGQPYQLDEHLHHSTPSIGIVIWGAGDTSSEDLLKHADHAMYQAKAAGRNQLCFFDPLTQAALAERAALEADLREALPLGQLELHYQAQVGRDGALLGAETLLRWRHPQRGFVSPAVFIPLAEQTGLIGPLGEWVMQQACARLAAWATQPALAGLSLAINVSAHQFRQKGFLGLMQQLLARSGAPTERLKIELTESALVNDVEAVITLMNELRRLGLAVSLDDFGTGYSSLAYLKRLPLNQLKIDQSFVRDLISEPNARAIARTVIQLGDSLGLQVIAEGVETEAQRALLAELGCHAFQGYLFSRPLPVAAFEALAGSWNAVSEAA
ncbi:bifunctional diguanylate cyclase/phosphodiesterase [Paucibacter sp. XJ19-41]|uniref:bifunctional diguanylate cyclase/phosphodiesterase n=1 Tax=Paucibacter sp. XJ19-41 TaxID=2927824 RepID=UPI00234A1827|nr:EAL domain-containing protein [Paucibacter sp. XJ19-41]MDC6170512.1 EAL domain-containing protein [Paucibacter sp. XJ19-41]